MQKLQAMPLELLRLLKGVIKTIAKLAGDVLEAALELINILLGRLFDAFESKIDIPVLNNLVQLWSGDSERKLSYFDIFTLPFAFIGTAIWKIVSGKAIVTEDMTATYIPWAERLPAVMDFSSLESSGAKLKRRSVGAAAVAEGTLQTGNTLQEVMIFLRVMAALTILVAIAGILIGLTAQPVATVAEILVSDSGKAGVVVTVMTLIPVLIMLTYELVSMFYEVIDGRHIPSGDAITDDYKSTLIRDLVLAFSLIAVGVLTVITCVVIKSATAITALAMNTVINVLSIIAGLGLLAYSIYKVVNHSIDHGEHGGDEHLWGIGIEIASGIGSLIGVAGSVSVIIASLLIKGEGISGAIMTAAAVGLQASATIISKGSTIATAVRDHEMLDRAITQ